VLSRNLVIEEALAHWGLLCQIEKNIIVNRNTFSFIDLITLVSTYLLGSYLSLIFGGISLRQRKEIHPIP